MTKPATPYRTRGAVWIAALAILIAAGIGWEFGESVIGAMLRMLA